MKEFLKYTLATIVGIIITSIILTFFSFIFLAALVSSTDKQVEVKPKSVLHLNLSNPIPERSINNPFEGFNPLTMKIGLQAGLNDILKNIKKAKSDDDITGIYLDLGILSPGYGTLEELRNALIDFKESGKFILAYTDNFLSQPSIYIATVADELYVHPGSFIEFFGMRAEITFYKNALEKLGVEAQVVRHGKFKSFIEPYTLEKMSDENREQVLTYIGAIWDHMLDGISEKKGIDKDVMNQWADNLEINTPESAMEKGLIDGIKYWDEVLEEIRELAGLDKDDNIPMVSQVTYSKVPAPRKGKGLSRNKIAVIYATGQIGQGIAGGQGIDGSEFAKSVRKARTDSSVKAIVIRVNSPGGGVIESDIMWREIDLAHQVKPVVASMGNVAASGGYYIVSTADTIFASPTSITGSIGVWGMIPNAQKLLNDKLGLTFDVAKTNENADFLSIYRPMKPAEREFMQNNIERTYDDFIALVGKGREKSVEEVDAIGQGRVWAGSNALEIGLIDGFGGLTKSIETAAELAGIETYRVVELPRIPDPYEQLLKDLTGGMKSRLLMKELGENYKHYLTIKEILGLDHVQVSIPYRVELY